MGRRIIAPCFERSQRPKGGANMRKYEIMFIVRPNLEEKEIKAVATEFESILKTNKVKVSDKNEWGQKELAYEIAKHKTGYYYVYNVEGSVEALKEVDRLVNLNENIIRYIIINKENE
jgi:small subunit ribosomal protein S6